MSALSMIVRIVWFAQTTSGLGLTGTSAGSLDREVIRRVVQSHAHAVRGCYERQLAKQPTLAGKVSPRFSINDTGRVTKVEFLPSTPELQPVEACMSREIATWRFPPLPRGSGPVTITYPFVFRTTDSPTGSPTTPATVLPVLVADAAHDMLQNEGRVPYRVAAGAGLALDLGAVPLRDANAIVLRLGSASYRVPLVAGKKYYVLDGASLQPMRDSKPFAGLSPHAMGLVILTHLDGDKLTELWTANLLIAPSPSPSR